MLLLTIFAALASGLAAVGVYGVVAFLVAQGTKEMGIRMALGATPRAIGLLVLRHGLVIALAGLAVGVAGAFVLTRLMRSLLFGVGSTDPVTYALVSALVVATAIAACCLPPRRPAGPDAIASVLSEGLRPSDSPTRALGRRFAGSLRPRGSLAAARSRLRQTVRR